MARGALLYQESVRAVSRCADDAFRHQCREISARLAPDHAEPVHTSYYWRLPEIDVSATPQARALLVVPALYLVVEDIRI